MTMTRKSRELKLGPSGSSSGSVERFHVPSQSWQTSTSLTPTKLPSYMGSQVTDSENHQWPPPSGVRGDVGGSFYTEKYSGRIPTSRIYVRAVDPTYNVGSYKGKRITLQYTVACPIETVGSGASLRPKWPTKQNSSTSSLNAWGAKAINYCKPTSSSVELSTALGELFRDGIPRALGANTWEGKTLAARNAGDEYLNVQFGWLPLVSDISSFGKTVADSDAILKQYDADRGKVVRRRFEFPVEENVVSEILSFSKPPVTGGTISTGITGTTSTDGVWSKETKTTKRRWFSGAFVYGAPLGLTTKAKSADLAAKADKLFGVSLTPDVVWNLTPWSWATDWVFNTGDVLSNISDFISQGLVMRYGYLMEETIVKVTYSLRGVVYYDHPVNVPDATLVVSTKSRVRANPYGFGITWDGLSSTQLAILSALGISRS